MKKYIIILFLIIFSLVCLGIKQRVVVKETIIVEKQLSLGPIIIYNYNDHSKFEAVREERNKKLLEEAQKNMSPEEFEKWKPWMTNTIGCTDCSPTTESYGFPLVYTHFCFGFCERTNFNIINLLLDVIICFALTFIFGGFVYLLIPKSVNPPKTGSN